MTRDELHAKLKRSDVGALAAFLVQLAAEDATLRGRIEDLALRAEPSAHTSSLDRRLDRLRDGPSPIPERETRAFADELSAWLDDVESGLLDRDPVGAWERFDAFIRADREILSRADDPDGQIRDVFRRACGLWHRAATGLPAETDRVKRVYDLHAGNDCGARDAILDEAASSLFEIELRTLARIYERQVEAEVPSGSPDPRVDASVALGRVARALRDAVLYEQSVRARAPEPSAVQAEDIAARYLEFGPVRRAVEWLTRAPTPPGHPVQERLDLLARAYEKLGDAAALRDVRRRCAEESLSAKRLAEYTELLPHEEREPARRAVLDRACQSDRPVAAAELMLELGEVDLAAATLLRLRDHLGAQRESDVLPLAQHFEQAGRPLPAVACYRALVDQILRDGSTQAYSRAKRYVDALTSLDEAVESYGDLDSHATHLARLRSLYRDRPSFWQLVDAAAS